jgi:tritrans,polycis-undecaprenyl-diphosphate synthase [geranylgeranyl-diphosphate specific]
MKTEEILDWARDLGIQYITLYSFSTENFTRESDEVRALFTLFREKFLAVQTDERVRKYGIRVSVVGDRSLLPKDLLDVIADAEEATKANTGHYLNVALAYGGRNEIVHAARRILSEVESGECPAESIDTGMVERYLHDGIHLPPVDLVIRSGNDYRTSNFLPWLANGHECAVYFSAPYWPLFRKIDLLRAIRVYSQRTDEKIVALHGRIS